MAHCVQYDVIHQTGSIELLATPPEETEPYTRGKKSKSGEGQACSSGDILADRQAEKHTNTQTRSSQYSAPLRGGGE